MEEIIVHTGQHYDQNMSEIFFTEMSIPRPKYNLEVGSGTHGAMTAKMIEGLEQIFFQEKPDAIVVYGDTNSTLAGAIAAAKIYIPIVHIEAGLRSFNKRMQEELNRIACDHMSTLLFCPTQTGINNIQKEGFKIDGQGKASIDQPKVYHCGDIMYDNSLFFSTYSKNQSTILDSLYLSEDDFFLCTIHRDSNTDQKESINAIFQALLNISKKHNQQIVLPLHPRTKNKINEHVEVGLRDEIENCNALKIIPPAGFFDIIELEKNARLIITDSGGLQKEAFFFKKPCVILREQTEWIEIVENGNAIIAGSNQKNIEHAVDTLLTKKNFTYPSYYGDGNAADFIVQKILTDL